MLLHVEYVEDAAGGGWRNQESVPDGEIVSKLCRADQCVRWMSAEYGVDAYVYE